MIIYEYLKLIFHNEYKEICQNINLSQPEQLVVKDKKKKIRKKSIFISII